MANPYEVLGLKEGAGEAEIKAAYREMVKKYHPDKHQDNSLRDLAEEKMREVNEAYDQLMGKNAGGSNFGGGGGYSYGGSGASGGSRSAEFGEVRRDIDRGDLSGAERKLQAARRKNAEWYFLYGMVNIRRGWYNDGISNIQTAVAMEPGNIEYRNALNSIMNQQQGYSANAYQRGYSQNNSNDMFCQALQCYCCADMCCDCI
ncbi:MAG: J domain-containing protein [Clostridiales Family XIII bacterium]|jgi:molecular chaperone DnaJ|nr:J domain-containing protein [Clostridiales Family XIII bacterium]